MDSSLILRKKIWQPEHERLLHELLNRGEINPEKVGKRHLQRLFDTYPLLSDFAEGNKYRVFRNHLLQIISDRIIQHTKDGKRRKGKFYNN